MIHSSRIFLIVWIVLFSHQAHAFGHLKNIEVKYSLIESLVQKHRILYCIQDQDVNKDFVKKSLDQYIQAIEQDVHVWENSTSKTLVRMKDVNIEIKEDCDSEDTHVLNIETFDDGQWAQQIKKLFGAKQSTSHYVHGRTTWFVDGRPTVRILVNHEDQMASQNNFISTYLHEIGHAFGLCDQYTPDPEHEIQGYRNCDPNAMTRHRFELSVMNEGGSLHADDIEGLIALFDRYNRYKRTGRHTTIFEDSTDLEFSRLTREYVNGILVGPYDLIFKNSARTHTMHYAQVLSKESSQKLGLKFDKTSINFVFFPKYRDRASIEKNLVKASFNPFGKIGDKIELTIDRTSNRLISMSGQFTVDAFHAKGNMSNLNWLPSKNIRWIWSDFAYDLSAYVHDENRDIVDPKPENQYQNHFSIHYESGKVWVKYTGSTRDQKSISPDPNMMTQFGEWKAMDDLQGLANIGCSEPWLGKDVLCFLPFRSVDTEALRASQP
ncbi:MAG: hypothetical protein R3A11_06585 [Bdellovibrionota bacterium]